MKENILTSDKDLYSFIINKDPTCEVVCTCGERVWASDHEISWCNCGKGFKTNFNILSFTRKEK
jgi:hypothetical protein